MHLVEHGLAALRAENLPGGDAPLWYSRFIALCMQLGTVFSRGSMTWRGENAHLATVATGSKIWDWREEKEEICI